MTKLLIPKWQIEDRFLGVGPSNRLGEAKDMGQFIEFEISGEGVPDLEYIGCRFKRSEQVEFYETVPPSKQPRQP